jgi:hypothetical protein
MIRESQYGQENLTIMLENLFMEGKEILNTIIEFTFDIR